MFRCASYTVTKALLYSLVTCLALLCVGINSNEVLTDKVCYSCAVIAFMLYVGQRSFVLAMSIKLLCMVQIDTLKRISYVDVAIASALALISVNISFSTLVKASSFDVAAFIIGGMGIGWTLGQFYKYSKYFNEGLAAVVNIRQKHVHHQWIKKPLTNITVLNK